MTDEKDAQTTKNIENTSNHHLSEEKIPLIMSVCPTNEHVLIPPLPEDLESNASAKNEFQKEKYVTFDQLNQLLVQQDEKHRKRLEEFLDKLTAKQQEFFEKQANINQLNFDNMTEKLSLKLESMFFKYSRSSFKKMKFAPTKLDITDVKMMREDPEENQTNLNSSTEDEENTSFRKIRKFRKMKKIPHQRSGISKAMPKSDSEESSTEDEELTNKVSYKYVKGWYTPGGRRKIKAAKPRSRVIMLTKEEFKQWGYKGGRTRAQKIASGIRRCYSCGKNGHVSTECPTPGQKHCYNCNRTVNHVAKNCPVKKKRVKYDTDDSFQRKRSRLEDEENCRIYTYPGRGYESQNGSYNTVDSYINYRSQRRYREYRDRAGFDNYGS